MMSSYMYVKSEGQIKAQLQFNTPQEILNYNSGDNR